MSSNQFSENPYQSPPIRAELVKPQRQRHKWHWSYSAGLIAALCLSFAMPDSVGKTEYVIFLGIMAAGLWVWTRF